jgi:hypothetical protein
MWNEEAGPPEEVPCSAGKPRYTLSRSSLRNREYSMPSFDVDLLRADPVKIALGADAAEAAESPSYPNRACDAARDSFRVALMFRVAFTTLTFIVGAATAIAVAYVIYRATSSGGKWNTTATLAAIGAAVTGAGAIYLGKRSLEAIKVARTALDDVGKYCGIEVKKKLG